MKVKQNRNQARRPLECIKSIEPTTFPQCIDVLIQQTKRIKRSWFIANKRASVPHPTEDLTPIDYGWILDGKCLAVKWFERMQVPQELEYVDYLSGSNAEDSDIDESEDEDALEINKDEIGVAPFYEDSL